jgi:hypothetical protein
MKANHSECGPDRCARRESGEHLLVVVLLVVVIALAMLLLLGLPQALDLAAGHTSAATDWLAAEHAGLDDPEVLRAEREIEWWL